MRVLEAGEEPGVGAPVHCGLPPSPLHAFYLRGPLPPRQETQHWDAWETPWMRGAAGWGGDGWRGLSRGCWGGGWLGGAASFSTGSAVDPVWCCCSGRWWGAILQGFHPPRPARASEGRLLAGIEPSFPSKEEDWNQTGRFDFRKISKRPPNVSLSSSSSSSSSQFRKCKL